MNLLELRQHIREVSGLYDFVDADGSDNGMNFYINAGMRFLDRLIETQKSWASCFRFILPGLYGARTPYCRAIKEVWVATTSERWQLEKVSLQDLIAGYMTALPSGTDSGSPLYYSPAITRYIPENETCDTFESFVGYVDIPCGTHPDYNSILVMPPPEEKVVVEVKGLFYSMDLVEDTDENWWSVVHPEIVTMATMYQIEITNRNTQGANDWLNSIIFQTTKLEMDLVQEIIAEVDQMEG